MAVSAKIEESCRLDARPVDFGALPAGGDRIDADATIVLICTPAAGYVVTMDEGRHGAGGARRMADAAGTGYLGYEIYQDAARTRPWGATLASAMSAVAPASGRVELDVHARLADGKALPGSYADTVTVTVAF